MKNKNYLVRYFDGSFFLAKGLPLKEDKTLALVHAWSRRDVDFPWLVIDIASGTFVVRGRTKRKCLENYKHKDDCLDYGIRCYIEEARGTQRYRNLCEQIEVEKHIWIESGYDIEM